MIDYSNFQKSLKKLEIRNEYRKSLDASVDEQIRESIDESTIQRFKICYDCLWNTLKHYLEGEGLTKVPASPKGLVRFSLEKAVLSSSFEQWGKYIKARIGTTHDYSGEKVNEAIQLIDDFIDDAIELYQTMTGKTWGVERNIDITAAQKKIISDLLEAYIPNTEVWVYGSRVKWTAKPYSDLDMVAFSTKEQDMAVFELREAFEESDLSFRVDFFVWDEIPENFHENIKKEHIVLQKR